MESADLTDRSRRIAELADARRRDLFLRVSGLIVILMIAISWVTSGPLLGRLTAKKRWENFNNFLGDLVPSPVRKPDGNWTDFFPWAAELITDGGFKALLTTMGIATAAIIISGALVIPFLTLASRRLARIDPFGLPTGKTKPVNAFFWKVIGRVARFCFVLTRAIPEYLLAFLLLSLLGRQVWPLVLALAIHNFGILGRLWSEVVENADIAVAEHSIAAGASRSGVFLTNLFPAVFNRFLIYFFYRWETCVKDATVLGMLGLLTLGELIIMSKGFHWDRMFFYILLGSSVILAGDLLSTWIRRRLG